MLFIRTKPTRLCRIIDWASCLRIAGFCLMLGIASLAPISCRKSALSNAGAPGGGRAWPAAEKLRMEARLASVRRYDVIGKAIDERQQGIAGAEVILYYSHGLAGAGDRVVARTTTNEQGKFLFKKAICWGPECPPDKPNRFAVLVQSPGKKINGVAIHEDDPTTRVVIALATGSTPTMQVCFQDTAGKPIPDVKVLPHSFIANTLPNANESWRPATELVETWKDTGFFSAVTGADGQTSVPESLDGSDAVYRMEKEGYATAYARRPYNRTLYPSARVEGRVTWPDGAPAADAHVILTYSSYQNSFSYGTITDAEGRYVFTDAPCSGFNEVKNNAPPSTRRDNNVKLTAMDLRPNSHCIEKVVSLFLEPGQRAVRDIQLGPGWNISGVLVEISSQQPVPGMRIMTSSYNNWRSVVTDAQGRFRFKVPDGEYGCIRWVKQEHGSLALDMRWLENYQNVLYSFRTPIAKDIENLAVPIRIMPLAPLKGRVVGANGQGIANTEITLNLEGPAVRCDSQGFFTLPAVASDRENLICALVWDERNRRMIEVYTLWQPGTGDMLLQVETEKFRDFAGVMMDQNNHPVPNLQLLCYPVCRGKTWKERFSTTFTSDPAGKFVFPALDPKGSYCMRLSLPNNGRERNLQPEEIRFDLAKQPSRATSPTVFRIGIYPKYLTPPYTHTLAGRILSSKDNSPIAGALVQSWRMPRREQLSYCQFQTGENGEFLIDQLGDGTVELSVRAKGYVNKTFRLPSNKLQLQLTLEPCPPSPQYYIFVGDEKQNPIRNAKVEMSIFDDSARACPIGKLRGETKQYGDIVFTWTPPADRELSNYFGILRCEAPGYIPHFQGFQLGQDFGVKAVMRPEGPPLRGQVFNPKGKPVRGAAIEVWHILSEEFGQDNSHAAWISRVTSITAVTDVDGWFQLRRLRYQDNVVFQVKAKGSEMTYGHFTPKTGAITSVTLQAARAQQSPQPTGILRGQVVAEGGGALPKRLRVMIRSKSGWPYHNASQAVGADGAFELRDLPANEYCVSCDQYLANNDPSQPVIWSSEQAMFGSDASVEVKAGQASQTALTVHPSYLARGKVICKQRSYYPGGAVSIHFTRAGAFSGHAPVRPDGSWVTHLLEGENATHLGQDYEFCETIFCGSLSKICVKRNIAENYFTLSIDPSR
ncbi:MAG: hypothetical protein NTX50_26900 [Candidatus Sumerlaeota bacterium]|nr:hypothetical protein [Candidatus Sumerlaeota bacterium]